MKTAIVAGTPGSGKTTILIHTINDLLKLGYKCCVTKIDCLYTDDDVRYRRLGIPVQVGLSKDMCPDHFTIYNFDDIITWAGEQSADILVIETAGLCHRCAPYSKNSVGICVLDSTAGPKAPFKLGPFLNTADIAVIGKGDMISQAEREIFRESVLQINPRCLIIEANGLSGRGSAELAKQIYSAKELQVQDEELRHSAPLSICTLCVGETRINKQYHRGVLRNIDGFTFYSGE